MIRIYYFILTILIVSIVLFQVQLWFGRGGYGDSVLLAKEIAMKMSYNAMLHERNNVLHEKIYNIKNNSDIIDAEIRFKLNLIKPNELLLMIDDDYK